MAARATVKPKTSEIQTIPLEERINQRAYEIYMQRGGLDGSDLDDWLQAETEIRQVEEENPSPREAERYLSRT